MHITWISVILSVCKYGNHFSLFNAEPCFKCRLQFLEFFAAARFSCVKNEYLANVGGADWVEQAVNQLSDWYHKRVRSHTPDKHLWLSLCAVLRSVSKSMFPLWLRRCSDWLISWVAHDGYWPMTLLALSKLFRRRWFHWASGYSG